jgi:hypothetical protein
LSAFSPPKPQKESEQKTPTKQNKKRKAKFKTQTQDSKIQKKRNDQTSRAPAGIIAYTHTQIFHFRLRSAVGRKQKTAKIRETPG